MLDLGCGDGEFLNELKKKSWISLKKWDPPSMNRKELFLLYIFKLFLKRGPIIKISFESLRFSTKIFSFSSISVV